MSKLYEGLSDSCLKFRLNNSVIRKSVAGNALDADEILNTKVIFFWATVLFKNRWLKTSWPSILKITYTTFLDFYNQKVTEIIVIITLKIVFP